MLPITSTSLLRRHVAPFLVSFAMFTALLLAVGPATRGNAGFETLLLSVPFIAATTIPIAVLTSVLWVFTRLGAAGAIAAAQREREGLRRLVVPVLAAATGVAVLAMVLNTQVVPRTNARLLALRDGARFARNDRTMTVAELRAAARDARDGGMPNAAARVSAFEVEIHKKFALAAACIVLAVAGMATVLPFPRGGRALVVAATVVIPGLYYVCLVAGEALADQLLVAPFVAMWMANVVLLVGASLVVWRSGGRRGGGGGAPIALHA